MTNVAELLYEQELLNSRINKMLHGSVEIRQQNDKKYIYVHYRDVNYVNLFNGIC